jgi:hypothetical protein
MQSDQFGNGLWRPPSKSAFRRDAEIRYNPLRCCGTAPCTFDPICKVDETEIKFCARLEPEVAQRQKIRIVVPIARYWHVQPRDRSVNSRCEAVVHIDHAACIGRLANVLVARIAVAKVDA